MRAAPFNRLDDAVVVDRSRASSVLANRTDVLWR